MISRKAVINALVWSVAALSLGVQAQTKPDAFPNKPVKLVTLAGPGGALDVIVRAVADGLSKKWGTGVIVDNKPGASGMIATDLVARAAPDGYTVLMTTQTPHIYNPLLRKTSYDPFKDFQPVSEVVRGPIALVTRKAHGATTVREVMDAAKKAGRSLTYGTWGIGSGAHLLGEQLAKQVGVPLIHAPYKGEAAILQDLLGGGLDISFMTAAGAKAQLGNGQITILGVTGEKRSEHLPGAPTFKEQGLEGMDFGGWIAAFVPAKVDAATLAIIEAGIREVVNEPEFKKRMANMTMEAVGSSGAELAAVQKKEYDQWAQLLRTVNIKLE